MFQTGMKNSVEGVVVGRRSVSVSVSMRERERKRERGERWRHACCSCQVQGSRSMKELSKDNNRL